MPVLNRDEYFRRIQEIIGDNSDEMHTRFLEDMTDTYNDFETRVVGENEDWKKKYIENDAAWRQRYRDRFFHGGDTAQVSSANMVQQNSALDITFDDLFNSRRG